jgi:general secretion pathway protein G
MTVIIARQRRSGFTLIEVIVAVAIVVVLAGAITPMVFRELMQAREDATVSELSALSRGLADFYADTGRLPSEVEGLAALVADPGVTGWQGPYVASGRGDPVQEATTDEFNRDYAYDLAPTTVPADAAAALVASGGVDGTFDAGSVGGTWTLAGGGDDLVQPVVVGPIDRDKQRECDDELAALAEAARAFYEDRAAFPTSTAQLSPDYLDAGVDGGAFLDPWNQGYGLVLVSGGTTAEVLWIRSRGPDRQDDGGGDDDRDLMVSSVPPGRKTSLWKLAIAQTALNNNPTLALTGSWPADRTALGLADAFASDGWGRSFAVNVASRPIYSVGPDGNGALVGDNLPAGVGP